MKSEKGAALVEMALILPILIVLLFGIIDFGRIFHAYLTLDHAGREAAREASVGNDETTVINRAVGAASGLISTSQVNVDFDPDQTRGSYVTVTLTHQVDYLTPVIGNLVSPFPLTDVTKMRIE